MIIDNNYAFKGINCFSSGIIQQILKKSYSVYIDYFPNERERLYDQWKKEDCEAFTQKHIGNCVAFTCINGQPIGYFSWDDRQFPLGIIGQNCILPKFRGKGYGYKQIEWITAWFRERNFSEIKITTGNHPFFFPASQMYEKCGFTEQSRRPGRLFDLVEYLKCI